MINLEFINTYVRDDLGLISTSIRTQQNLLYVNSRTMQSSNADEYFYKVSLFMVKNKEQHYNRKFLKLTEAVSQVGGIYNVFFFLGCLIA